MDDVNVHYLGLYCPLQFAAKNHGYFKCVRVLRFVYIGLIFVGCMAKSLWHLQCGYTTRL
jgi:hypothetical protein